MPSVPKLTFSVTLHVFSGRRNPSWRIEPSHPRYTEILECLGDIPSTTLLPRLGYRGFSIQIEADPEVIDQNYRTPLLLLANHAEKEMMFLQTAPDTAIESNVLEHAVSTIGHMAADKFPRRQDGITNGTRKPATEVDALTQHSGPATGNDQCPTPGHGADGSEAGKEVRSVPPLYEPEKWNNDQHMTFNSCYNYANDIITDTFAIPGRGTAHKIPSDVTGNDVMDAATFDGLLPVNASDPDCLPPHTWNLVALVFWPSKHAGEHCDYHFYRLDNTNQFSHKPGQTAVINHDNVGRPIADPRHCNRGPYTQFVGFMQTLPTKIKII